VAEYFTVGWNVIEAVVAIGAGIIRALDVVAATFFLLAAYILVEAGSALVQGSGRTPPPLAWS
jgi:hypothetical protein